MKNPKLSKLAAAMPFAHFFGLPTPSAASAEEDDDDDRKQRADESDEDYAKRMEEQDKKDEEARKAEEDKRREDARRAEDEDEDDEADAEEDERDDKEDGKRAGRAKGARQRERVRCAAIVAEGLKLGSTKQACAFAFDTSMTASQAINALRMGAQDRGESGAKARGLSLDERMAHARPANPGASAPVGSSPSTADQIIAAGKERRGEI